MASGRRIGFIGISANPCWATRSHLPFLKSDRNTGHFTIVGLQNTSTESAERAAVANGLENVKLHDKPEDIASSDADIIAVSVKVPDHRAAVVPALKAGKDIFVEWPLARNLDEAIEMTELAKAKGVRTMVGLQARQSPAVVALKQMVDAGDLGEIRSTTMHGYGMIFGDVNDLSYEYCSQLENGANLLTIPFSHATDALCYVLGEFESISASLANTRPVLKYHKGEETVERPKSAHDLVSVTGFLKSGGIASLLYEGGENPSGKSSFVWQVNGSKGCALLEGPMGHPQMIHPSLSFAKTGEELKEVDINPQTGDLSYAVGEAWNAFAGQGQGHLTTFEDALVRHRMIHAIYTSNEKGGQHTKYLS